MTNHELRDIIHKIEKTDRLNLTEMAEKAHVDRSYVSKIINLHESKDVGKRVLSKFQGAFPEYFPKNNENNASGNNNYVVVNDVQIRLSDYLSLLKEMAAKAEEREKDYKKMLGKVVDSMATNLKDTLAYAEEISLQVNAASTVALKSLARQEKQPEESLIVEAGKERAHLWKKRQKLRNRGNKDKSSIGIHGS